jgi:hypothetical protein
VVVGAPESHEARVAHGWLVGLAAGESQEQRSKEES